MLAALDALPVADMAVPWPPDDHRGWRHADAWTEELSAPNIAEHIAAAAGLPAEVARRALARVRLLAVLYRQPELDERGNLIAVRVGTEPWPGAHEVTSELLLVGRVGEAIRALRWEWAEEAGTSGQAQLVSTTAAVTLDGDGLSGAYLFDDTWPEQPLWRAHADRARLYRLDGRRIVTGPALPEHLRGLAARSLALQAAHGPASELPGPAPRQASLREALWSPRRLS